MRGEVGPVRRFEVTQCLDGCGEIVALLLQITEHLAASTFDFPFKLLRATERIGLQPLRIDPSLRLDSLGSRPGIGGELMCGSVGFLPNPVGVFSGLLHQAFGLLGGHLDEPDDCRARFLPGRHHDGARHRLCRGRLPRWRWWLNCRRRRHRLRSRSRDWRCGLEGLDLLLQILVLLEELRETFLDLVDELVNFQDLVARLAGHSEPLVAYVVERRGHRAPRYLGGTFRWKRRLTGLPYPIWSGCTAEPTKSLEPDSGRIQKNTLRLICIKMLTKIARPMKARSSIMLPILTGFRTFRSRRSGGSVME